MANGWSVYNPTTKQYEWSPVSKGGSSVPWNGPIPSSASTTPAPTSTPSSPAATAGSTSFANQINLDAILGQQRAQSQAESVADLASRNAAINRDYIRAGYGLGNLNGLDPSLRNVISEASQTAAAGNQFSTAQRIAKAYADQQVADRVSLRQRGGVRSGEQGYLAQRTLTAKETGDYDALNNLLDSILGYNNQYVSAERTRQQRSFEAMLQALMNQLELLRGQPASVAAAQTSPTGYATAYSPGAPVTWLPKYQPGAPDVMIGPGWTRGN